MQSIRIVQISLSFHRASAAYIKSILESFGYKVEIMEAPHEMAFQLLEEGDADLLASAWLPGSHQKYLDPIKNEVMKLGVIYEPYCIWAVPDYTSPSIRSVADLKKDTAEDIERTIVTINPGAGISRFSLEIMDRYELDGCQYQLKNSSEEDFVEHVEKGIEERKLFIIPFWHPQALHDQYQFRELMEPYGYYVQKTSLR